MHLQKGTETQREGVESQREREQHTVWLQEQSRATSFIAGINVVTAEKLLTSKGTSLLFKNHKGIVGLRKIKWFVKC